MRETELIASATIASHLPSLETVTWSTWFACEGSGDDAKNQTTAIWIAQDHDGVLAKRGHL